MEFTLRPRLREAGTDAAGAVAAPSAGGLAQLVGDLIERTGLLPPEQLALVRARAGNGSFAEALLAEGAASGEGVARVLAGRYQLPLVDLPMTAVDTQAASLIPLHALQKSVAIPYRQDEDRLYVAIADPQDVNGIDELRLATRYPLDFAVAARDDILTEIQRLERMAVAAGTELLLEQAPEPTEDPGLDADDGVSDAPIVRLVNSVLTQAAEAGASDVHLEPREDALVVRFRVDGVLQEVQRIPRRLVAGVTTRLKVLAKLDIAERRKPQDGRISLNAAVAGRTIDLRVATLPTVDGEGVVMRLLDKSKQPPTLQELGLLAGMQEGLGAILARPTGALLVTGPTGSGKSTTLYGALSKLNSPEINIITVEDPVEYRLPGVNQMQINARAGLTFATALRSILRSDPDVIMVGEIRDGETAKIAIEAALTGHFVLSTLHTNDAPSALTRLVEMGVEPFLTGAVSAVLAQRLARKLCTHCSERYTATLEELLKARVSPEVAAAAEGRELHRKRGCPRCSQTGYRGRVGVFQLLTMSDALESIAARRGSRDELDRVARQEGMGSLWDDGLAKVAEGLTSVEELARVCG